ncbi:hypothetical protein B0T22DRAFT_155442 [Podospora appendiculata]|uniref:Uncharacterized protein n=1 Tax=Podospora appendiculata TaxID=314037 RepID=A0AAE1CCJ4_9PEZI|nr:hypothetical protein B0T22DRAFT_155442 [Podospora appendiculata]
MPPIPTAASLAGLLWPRSPAPGAPPASSNPAALAARIVSRQSTTTIPSLYGSLNSGPDPGTVAGIVLGSVAGFILLLWLLYTCINMGNPEVAESSVGTASYVSRKHRHSHHHHHHRPHGETVEIRATSRSGPPAGATIIVEERERRPSIERIVVEDTYTRRPASRGGPVQVVEDDDDEVVVIEEHSPERRRRSRVRSAERRSSVYRERRSSRG